MLSLLNELNPEQRLAAETIDGPVLILAGAGTRQDTRNYLSHGEHDCQRRAVAEAILAVDAVADIRPRRKCARAFAIYCCARDFLRRSRGCPPFIRFVRDCWRREGGCGGIAARFRDLAMTTINAR